MSTYVITSSTARLSEQPDYPEKIGGKDSTLLYGESFEVTETDGDWLYGYGTLDGYKGYVHNSHAKKQEGSLATHFVKALATGIRREPDYKYEPFLALSMMSRLICDEGEEKDGFIRVADLGWIFKDDVMALDDIKPVDHVATAQMFMNVPYGYSNRSAFGIDCSGLVQITVQRNGIECLRDTCDQVHSLGNEVSPEGLKRGDFVYFDGHVVIMTDENEAINANMNIGKVGVQPFTDILNEYKEITAVRRLEL